MMRKLLYLTLLVLFANSAKAESTITWSYFYGPASEWKSIGTGNGGSFSVAILIPEGSPLIGQKIKTIKIPSVDAAMKNVSGWIRTSLESDNLVKKAVSGTFRKGTFADVELDAPFVIPEGGAYIGYTFTTMTKYPIATAGEDVSNGLFISLDGATWSDYSHAGLGISPLQLVVEGTFPENAAVPSSLGTHIIKKDGTETVTVTIENAGTAGLSNFDYIVEANGFTEMEGHVDLETPLTNISESTTHDFVFNAAELNKCITRTLTITKVNGKDNEMASQVSTGKFVTVDKPLPRNIVVEEFTGTGCGYCPRGLVGMETLREQYGDKFIGIGIHQYNSSDAMYFPYYPDLGFTGAPECTLMRNGSFVDPLYGDYENNISMDKLVKNEMDKLVSATLTVSGAWNADSTAVEATASVESILEELSYNIEYVLIADDLHGTGSSWNQSNYYSSSGSQGNALLDQFCSGGIYGQSSVSGYHFNDVVCGTSYVNRKNTAEPLWIEKAFVPQEREFTIAPTGKAEMLNAIQKDKVWVAVLLVDEDGQIINGAKAPVQGYVDTSIKTINNNAMEVARYTLDGQMISTPQKGVNIVKMSNGTTRKVVVK